MSDQPNLNPEPAHNPAEVSAGQDKPAQAELPKAAPVSADAAAQPGSLADNPGSGWRGAFAAVGVIFEQIKRNPEPAIALAAVYVVVALLNRYASYDGAYYYAHGAMYDRNSPQNLVLIVLSPAIAMYGLALAEKRKVSIADTLKLGAGPYLMVVAATFVYALAVFLSIIALIVPVVWVAAWFSLVSYIIIDKKLGIGEAFSESKRLMQDNKGKFWGIVGAAIVLSIGAGLLSIVPVIGNLLLPAASGVIAVLFSGVAALLYRWLQQRG